ncbi:6-aminohexanoate hydrolase, partial [Cribrihabitans sp. XS_ASV171]
MIDRRTFAIASCATLAVPSLVRGQTDRLRAFIEEAPQLHSLQIRQEDEIIFAEAPRGPGLDELAN